MSIEQDIILEKVNLYLELNNRPSYGEAGFCNGLVSLYLYKGKDWLHSLLEKISGCPDEELSGKVGLDIEKLLGHAEWLQNSGKYIPSIRQNNLPNLHNMIKEEDKESPFTQEFSFAFVFKEIELRQFFDNLFKMINEIRPPQYLALNSTDHAMGVSSRDNKLYLYDPNNKNGEIECRSGEDFINTIKSGFFTKFGKSAENMPIAVKLYSQNSTPKYSLEKQSQQALELLVNLIKQRKDIDIDLRAWDDSTALFIAAQHGEGILVKQLLQLNANPNNIVKEGATPLLIAAQNGYLSIVTELLSKNADPVIYDKSIKSPLMAAANNGHITVVETLLENASVKNNINQQDKNGTTALTYAMDHGHLNVVQILISNGSNPNIPDKDGVLPLHSAISYGYPDIVNYLLPRSNINQSNSKGFTPLHIAVIKNYPGIVEALLQKKPELNSQDNNGMTPLHFAVMDNYTQIIEQLLTAKANPNIQNIDGDTPLHMAIQEGNNSIAHKLLLTDANNTLENKDGLRPIDIAIQTGNLEMVRLITGKGNILNLEKDQIKFHQSIQPSITLQNQIPEIIRELEEVTKNPSPSIPEISKKIGLYDSLGCYFHAIGNYNQALANYEKLWKMNNNLENYYRIVLAKFDASNFGEALNDIKSFGTTLVKFGKYKEAIDICTKGLELFPNKASLLIQRGNIYDLQGNLAQALNDYADAFRRAPNDIEINNKYGQAQLKFGQQEASNGRPENATYHYKLAMLNFDKAYSLNPDNDTTLENCFKCLKLMEHPSVKNFEGSKEEFKKIYDYIRDFGYDEKEKVSEAPRLFGLK